MDGETRRKKLLQLLKNTDTALSGERLSDTLCVSRQIIVQDIALLRASGCRIISTNRGYLLYPEELHKASRIFTVSHSTEDIRDELYTIVDLGGSIRNVIVEHEIYGSITGSLNISSRREADDFVSRVQSSQAVPLKVLGGDIHSHIIDADSEEILDEIEHALNEKHFLL
ncbi:MAG: transcription repressor NadR [Acetivibrio ethanolgignens]